MYFDIVCLDLIENYDWNLLENRLQEFKITKLFIFKNINNKSDLNVFDNVKLPISKNITLQKIYFSNDLQFGQKNMIHNSRINVRIYNPENLSDLSKSLSIKKKFFIYNPIYDKLGFDEGCCSLCLQNNKRLLFNLNSFKYNTYKTIKQMLFISNIIQIHRLDFCFASFAKDISELIDPAISAYFLSEIGFDYDLVKNRFLINYEL